MTNTSSETQLPGMVSVVHLLSLDITEAPRFLVTLGTPNQCLGPLVYCTACL